MKTLKTLTLIAAFVLVGFQKSNVIKSDTASIEFHAGTPLEDIDATNTDVRGLINIKTGSVAFVAPNRGFHFKRSLMEEHFNENYMESDKYKVSTFKGKIINFDEIDLSKDGTYKAIVEGVLNIHGVEKERKIDGEIMVKGKEIMVKSDFMVKLADHKIDIPKIVTEKIAEEVKVNVNATFINQ